MGSVGWTCRVCNSARLSRALAVIPALFGPREDPPCNQSSRARSGVIASSRSEVRATAGSSSQPPVRGGLRSSVEDMECTRPPHDAVALVLHGAHDRARTRDASASAWEGHPDRSIDLHRAFVGIEPRVSGSVVVGELSSCRAQLSRHAYGSRALMHELPFGVACHSAVPAFGTSRATFVCRIDREALCVGIDRRG